jgi:tetratricopeptide (TPR) repeat protein
VITSRTGVGWERLASVLPVESLAPADAAGLLLSRAEETGPAATAAATTLAATLGGLPLALEQAAAYVASTGTITLDGYAGLFGTRALELLKRGQPLDYQHTVATTWSLALHRLRETEPAAVDLLTLASFLAPDDLPQPLLATHHDQLPEPLTATAGDPLAIADAVATLRRYSLIRVIADGLYVHRLLQTVIRFTLDADSERAWAATAVRLLSAGFPSESGTAAAWPECQRLLPHALTAVGHGKRLEVETPTWLSLLRRATMYLWSRGQYRQSLPLDVEILAGYRRLLGDDHPDTLWSMNNLAVTRRDLGDLLGARDLLEQTLAAFRRVLGDDHPDTLNSMNNLADTLRDIGDSHGARQLLEQALTISKRVLGDDHPHTLWSMYGLAETNRTLGDLDGARQLHEQALAGYRRVLGDDHPDTLWSMNSVGLTRQALGDLQGAHDLLEQAVSDFRRVRGEDHPDTLTCMSSLAMTRRALGDLPGARDLHEQALAGRRRVLGDDHSDTLTSMNNLTQVRRELGEQ